MAGNLKNIHKYLLILALLCFLGFVISWIIETRELAGISLFSALIFLGIGVRKHQFFRSFSYTIFILAAVTIAMFHPQYFVKVGGFEFKLLIIPLLQIIMFGMGSQLSLNDFAGVIKTPKAVFVGLVCQFTIMPLIAVILTMTFNFPPEIAAGIVLVGASPSGLASNVMSFLARANIALSVTLTAIATLLAPIMTPLMMKLLAGQMIPIDFWNMMLGIMDMVILPIIGGLAFNAVSYNLISRNKITQQIIAFAGIILIKNLIFYFTDDVMMQAVMIQFTYNLFWFLFLPVLGGLIFKIVTGSNKELMNKALVLISMIGIAVIITVITAAGRDSLVQLGMLLILACTIHNLLGYTLGYWVCRLLRMDEKSCRTIALEVGMQNSGLASGIALQMGKVATVGLAPSVFGPLMNITGSSLATWWRGKPIEEIN